MLKPLCAMLVALSVGCATAAPKAVKRTLPEPLVAADLPPEPKVEFVVPPEADWAVPVSGYLLEVDGGEPQAIERPGICMSLEKAGRAARYVVRYEELRGLYVIDLRTWGRERQIYERHLELAQDEVDALKKVAERSWFERNAGPIGLAAGLVLGIAAAAIGAGAIDAAAN